MLKNLALFLDQAVLSGGQMPDDTRNSCLIIEQVGKCSYGHAIAGKLQYNAIRVPATVLAVLVPRNCRCQPRTERRFFICLSASASVRCHRCRRSGRPCCPRGTGSALQNSSAALCSKQERVDPAMPAWRPSCRHWPWLMIPQPLGPQLVHRQVARCPPDCHSLENIDQVHNIAATARI